MQYTPETALASLVAVFLQERIKKSKAKQLAWITDRTPGTNQLVSALAAAATTAGVSYHWDSVTGALAVQGLTFEAAAAFLSAFVANYAVQWFLYKAIKKR